MAPHQAGRQPIACWLGEINEYCFNIEHSALRFAKSEPGVETLLGSDEFCSYLSAYQPTRLDSSTAWAVPVVSLTGSYALRRPLGTSNISSCTSSTGHAGGGQGACMQTLLG
jgi:hypothetical protein